MLEHCVGTIADLRYGLIELFRRNADDFEPIAGIGESGKKSPLYMVSIVLIFIGVFAFVAVLTRAL